MPKLHNYTTNIQWTGNQGAGTSSYKAYSRDHVITIGGKSADILASSDPSFLGDPSRYNPEELFLASIAACHMLWFLHLCTTKGIVVESYSDAATGVMEEDNDGSGRFTSVTLYPKVVVSSPEMIDMCSQLHHQANQMCFIANSCNFMIEHRPETKSV